MCALPLWETHIINSTCIQTANRAYLKHCLRMNVRCSLISPYLQGWLLKKAHSHRVNTSFQIYYLRLPVQLVSCSESGRDRTCSPCGFDIFAFMLGRARLISSACMCMHVDTCFSFLRRITTASVQLIRTLRNWSFLSSNYADFVCLVNEGGRGRCGFVGRFLQENAVFQRKQH